LSSKRVLFPSYVDFHITLTVNIASRRKGGKTEERSSSFFTINISVFFLFFLILSSTFTYVRKYVIHLQRVSVYVRVLRPRTIHQLRMTQLATRKQP
jgi:hypothetical protein